MEKLSQAIVFLDLTATRVALHMLQQATHLGELVSAPRALIAIIVAQGVMLGLVHFVGQSRNISQITATSTSSSFEVNHRS